MLAEPVQPSTKSSVQPSAASTKQKLSGLLANKNARIGIGAGAVLLIAILVYSLMGGKKPPTGAGKPGKKGTTKKTIVADDSPPKLKPAARTLGKIKQEWVVGSGAGEFKSLREAIENTKKFPNDHRRATQVIKVPGGRTFAERIVIDSSYPPGIQIEVQEGQESILAPGGAEPIVELKGNYDRFRLQGFRLDASGKESAIKLSGFLGAAQFKQLKIDGFTRSGIVVEGATAYGTEGEAIMLDGLTLSAANPQATGILFSKGADNPSHVEVRRCRFSAMQIGAAFETDASFVWVSESLFIKTPVGIKLDGTGRTWRDLEFSNNTFFENDRGILITNMPSSGSSGFGFYNNLFVGLKGPSVIVEQDYKDIAFAGMYNTIGSGVSNNWTDSATAPVPGEVNIFTASGGRRDVKDLQFVSRDPNSPDFLVPAPTSPHKAVGTINPKKFGNQIGALKPK